MIDILKTSKDELVKFNVRSIYEGHHQVTYRGVEAIRCPFDYVIYQMITYELQPDLIIEIGTNRGGGALYLADLLNNNGKGIVHTIDIHNQSDKILLEHPRIKLFYKGWENYDIDQAKNFKKVMVIEDASHIYEDTLASINKFGPVVSVGSYLIVEDGIIRKLKMGKNYNGGPLKSIKEFLKTNDNFQVDRKWCNLFGQNATFNVNGYLKKVK